VIEAENKLLKERRTLNQRRMSDANLDQRRVKVATEQLAKHKSRADELWCSETLEMAEDYPRLEAEVADYKTRLQVLTNSLKDAEAAETALAAVVYPSKPMDQGHFDCRMRFMCMKLIAMANLCPTRVPIAYKVISDYHGIVLPGRMRKVLVSVANGVKRFETKFLEWKPSETSCLRFRVEMGPFSQLQVGEYIIANGGTAGNFAVHSDGASSDGTELSAFVLGHRYTATNGASKVMNMLIDLNWAMDKTSATRASDFRDACQGVAKLCAKAGMADSHLVGEVIPSGSMNDRASPERLAAKLMTGCSTDGATCGEHGSLVNPMHYGTKAMDKVVQGWMGKSEADLALDADKSRALHMAVGWHSSPCGAVIYCTTKYGALKTGSSSCGAPLSTQASSARPTCSVCVRGSARLQLSCCG
jgi:hypothetical protein